MSWFGETLGDSLNSLKGQISKITKEVLSEDDGLNEDVADLTDSQIKELNALCSSKDIEIESLREENKKIIHQFQVELQLLRNENKNLKDYRKCEKNVLLSDDQIKQVCELETQLHQIKIERDHLEELQKDHQSNLCLILQQKDNYKHELEKLKEDYINLQSKCSDMLDHKCNDTNNFTNLSVVSLKDNEVTENKIVELQNIVEELHSQIELYHNEKEEMCKLNEKHTHDIEIFKEKNEKLLGEMKSLNNAKQHLEVENQNLRSEIENVSCELRNKIDNLKFVEGEKSELEERLTVMIQMLEACKIEQSSTAVEFQNHVKELLTVFNVKLSEQSIEKNSYIELIELIKGFAINNLKERKDVENMYQEKVGNLEFEIQKVKDENLKLRDDIKSLTDKWNEMEKCYKDEINSLQNKYLDLKSQEQDCIIKSQTDDVKRLNQEVTRLMDVVEIKNNDLTDYVNKLNAATQELNLVHTLSENLKCELTTVLEEREKLNDIVVNLKYDIENKVSEIGYILSQKEKEEEKCRILENENARLSGEISSLQSALSTSVKEKNDLMDNINNMKNIVERVTSLERKLNDAVKSKLELENAYSEVEQIKANMEDQLNCLKTELVDKNSQITEINNANQVLMDQMIKIQEECSRLQSMEQELNQRKEAIADLEIQRKNIREEKEKLEVECSRMKYISPSVSDLVREQNIGSVGPNSVNEKLTEAIGIQTEFSDSNYVDPLRAEIEQLTEVSKQQADRIAALTEENDKLQHQLQVCSERPLERNEEGEGRSAGGECLVLNEKGKDKLQFHRRSKSAAEKFTSSIADNPELVSELTRMKELSQKQLQDYKTLQEKFAKISEKESHSRRELERLKIHLIDIENDYTETIDEYKTKLSATEEQLKNSSTIYTSTKVRDNQHLESLQGQIRLITAQRDDLQLKLSAAEDEVQKHEAALTSFRVVLEQFQQDKEREQESLVSKYENQILLSERRYVELQNEVTSLNYQLSEAKNGLKAASRLGEQLERKSQQIVELEKKISEIQDEAQKLKESASLAHQSNTGKVDKSLIKNLVLGYLSSERSDRKAQVLRIMASVLDFDEGEKNKIGLDASHSSWLSNLLHPRSGDLGDTNSPSQSLSEAFIRFLENESRPQPHLKLLPERSPQPISSRTTPKPSLLLQELVLPTFNSPHENESTILKDVLKES